MTNKDKDKREALRNATAEYCDADFALEIAAPADVTKAKKRRFDAYNNLKAAVYNLSK